MNPCSICRLQLSSLTSGKRAGYHGNYCILVSGLEDRRNTGSSVNVHVALLQCNCTVPRFWLLPIATPSPASALHTEGMSSIVCS